ncbi:MAG: hypothetical protein AB7I50_09555 [Vicinamibacterales bacterium]
MVDRGRRFHRQLTRHTAPFLILMGLQAPVAFAASQAQVISRDAVIHGATFADWAVRWQQWLFSLPLSALPLTGLSCGTAQAGPVWFLDAPGENGSFTYECTIPVGKKVLVPIINVSSGSGIFDCEPTVPGVLCNIDDLRVGAAAAVDPAIMAVSLDGTPLNNFGELRVQSPVFAVTYPEDSIFGVPAGTYSPNLSDGYWLLLSSLSPGMHTINIKVSIPDGYFAGAAFESTYHLTIAAPSSPSIELRLTGLDTTTGHALTLPLTVSQPSLGIVMTPALVALAAGESFSVNAPAFMGACAFLGWVNPSSGYVIPSRTLSGNVATNQEHEARYRCP